MFRIPIIAIYFLLFNLIVTAQETGKKKEKARFSAEKMKGIYIPNDLEDCFSEINKFWNDSTKNEVRSWTEQDFIGKSHHGFGMWMRNNWGLWKGSRLSKYFNEKGIYHPDDMSGIILCSYHRFLTGKEIKLDEQIKPYQDYWKVVQKPAKEIYPKDAGDLIFNEGMYYHSKVNGQGFLHIGTTPKSEIIWLYDFYNGWAKVTKTDIARLSENQDKREAIIIEIFENEKKRQKSL